MFGNSSSRRIKDATVGSLELPKKRRRSGKEPIIESDSYAIIRQKKTKRRNDANAADFLSRMQQTTDWQSSGQNMVQPTLHPCSSENEVVIEVAKLARDDYSNLKNRTSPMILRDTIQKMNATQRQHVRDIGFGEILSLEIKDVPPKLAHWLLDNIDPKRYEVVLEDGRRVHVDEEDVRLMFRFPRGQNPIERRVKNTPHVLAADWRKRFEKWQDMILARDVSVDMKTQDEGGLWFKRQFLVLLTCCLVESLGNSYVSPQILDYFEDVDSVVDLNWCEYVIKCLIDHTKAWKENKDKYYTGPTLFINLLYVDRVVLGYRTVKRSIPAIRVWRDKMLVKRQELEIKSGGFGQGFPDEPFNDNELIMNDAAPMDLALINEGAQHVNEDVGPIIEEGADRINEDTDPINEETLGDTLSEIMTMVKGFPHEMLDNVVFRKILDASLLVGKKHSPASGEPSYTSHPTPTQEDIDFWGCPEHLAAIAEIEEAALKRDEKLQDIGGQREDHEEGQNEEHGTRIDNGKGKANIVEDESDFVGENNKGNDKDKELYLKKYEAKGKGKVEEVKRKKGREVWTLY